jgi:hypothetical protein
MNKNVIVGLMLKHVFPNGGINNTLWYGIKILLHNNGICMNDSEYIKIHEMLKNIHNRSFTENGLEEQYQNNYNGSIGENDIEIVPAMINKYLRLNKIKSIETGREGVHAPIFPISPRGKVPFDIKVDINPALIKKHTNENYKLNSFKQDPLKDIIELLDELFKIRRGDKLKDFLKEGDFAYTPMGAIFVRRDLEYIIISFIKNFRIKWGDNITIYMMKYYMDDYINCRRW